MKMDKRNIGKQVIYAHDNTGRFQTFLPIGVVGKIIGRLNKNYYYVRFGKSLKIWKIKPENLNKVV